MTVVTALLPDRADPADLGGDALRSWLADRYALRGDRWLRLNLVTTPGGQITGPTGVSDDLTGGIDRTLLGVLRRGADAVLVGAATARREHYVLPARARLAVATRGALTAADLPEPEGDRRALVVCPAGEADRLRRSLADRADVLTAEGADAIPAALARAGLGRVVCEGGGVLASELLAADTVDEFDQTIAPVVLAPGEPLLSGRIPPRTARLAGLLHDETDRLYLRWAFRAHRAG